MRAERATGALKARQAESTPAQAEHARWQMVESPGCARSAPRERRRRDGRSARQRKRSTLAHGGVTGEARIILRCSEAHPQATLDSPKNIRFLLEGFSSKIGSKIGWKIGSPHPILDPILQRPTRIRVNPPDFKTGWVKIGSKIGWVRNLK